MTTDFALIIVMVDGATRERLAQEHEARKEQFAREFEAIKEQICQAVEKPLKCARCGADIPVGLGVVTPLPALGKTETICRCCAGMSAVPAKRVPIGDPLPEF